MRKTTKMEAVGFDQPDGRPVLVIPENQHCGVRNCTSPEFWHCSARLRYHNTKKGQKKGRWEFFAFFGLGSSCSLLSIMDTEKALNFQRENWGNIFIRVMRLVKVERLRERLNWCINCVILHLYSTTVVLRIGSSHLWVNLYKFCLIYFLYFYLFSLLFACGLQSYSHPQQLVSEQRLGVENNGRRRVGTRNHQF